MGQSYPVAELEPKARSERSDRSEARASRQVLMYARRVETKEDRKTSSDRPPPRPGLLLVLEGGRATLRSIEVRGAITVGREADLSVNDERTSRAHFEVSRAKGSWLVRDLGSKNGTTFAGRTIRFGGSVAVLEDDLAPYAGGSVERSGGRAIGPKTKAVLDKVRRIARTNGTLHVTGPSGSGKELAARAFHEAGARAKGPFVAVNCASIPEGVAERVLFGAEKGAYSGADETMIGQLEAADGGTLFLDELAELDPAVQAKLLRAIETKEVTRLGGVRARKVEIGICSATHADLRAAVAGARFREDLYFRIGRPEVRLPPLFERPEEIAALIEDGIRRIDPELLPSPELVALCLERPWPGNVRELAGEIERAAHEALAADRTEVSVADLDEQAGLPFAGEEKAPPTDDVIREALTAEGGNVSAAARRLGLHRTQLRRWIARQSA
jgi:transcriptional regulator of acetoin/glycerol metabolism